jgi:hypothetical protein
VRALALAVVAAAEEVAAVVAVAVLLIVTSVVWAVAPAAALEVEVEVTGEEHHRVVTEVDSAPLLVATHLLLRHMAAVVAAAMVEVEATAIHPVLEAAPGGKHHHLRYTMPQPSRVAYSGIFSFPFLERLLRSPSLFLRNETDSGISYPNRHIDIDCFPADLPVLELYCVRYPFDDLVELEHDRRATRLLQKGMHYEHFTSVLLY